MPDLVPAYNEFISSGNWDTIEQARKSSYIHAKQIARQLKAMNSSGQATPENIEKQLM